MNWITPNWPLPQGVHAAMTLRTGGVSVGEFASLNPATHVNDAPEAVAENRRRIRAMLNLPSEPVWLQQVHGIEVIKADAAQGVPVADASYTEQSGVVCAIMTADCLPVLFCGDGEHGAVIAAAHAGWRGLCDGIISVTAAAMLCQNLQVWLGPAIGADCFEVGDDVREAFLNRWPDAADVAFTAKGNGKWLANMYTLAGIELSELGINRVYCDALCTVSDPERFYSYRRDGQTGRMATLIWRD